MPSNWLSIDTSFPSFTGEESPKEQIRALHDYLFQLRQGLQYSLQNLTAENFNAAALENMNATQKDQVAQELRKVYARLDQVAAQVDSLGGRVSDTEGVSARVSEAEQDIDDLEEWTGAAEEQLGDLSGRLETLEQSEDRKTLQELQGLVTGEGGIQERVTALEGETEKLSTAIQVAEDGSVTLGSEGKDLYLVGQIFINGVLYTQGGTA